MINQKNVFSFADFGSKRDKKTGLAIKQAFPSHNQNKVGESVSSRRKSKDLVGLLLGYGARTRRSATPRVLVHMEVFTPAGNHAVKISFKK